MDLCKSPVKRRGRPRRKKYPAHISLMVSSEQYRKISNACERFDLSIAEVVRDLIDNDISKLIERYRKRQKRGRND